MPRRPHPEQDAIIAAYRAGASVAEIVRQLGLSRSTVYARLRQGQVPLRVRARVRNGAGSPTDVAAISGAYQSGETMAAVAARFGLSYNQVARPARGWGHPATTEAAPDRLRTHPNSGCRVGACHHHART